MTSLNGFVPNQPPPYVRRHNFEVDLMGYLLRRRIINVRCLLYSLLCTLFSVILLGIMTVRFENAAQQDEEIIRHSPPISQQTCDCSSKGSPHSAKPQINDQGLNTSPSVKSRKWLKKRTTSVVDKNFEDLSEHDKLCILVPFRDRFEELQIFAPHMTEFLREQNVSFEIMVLNQLDLYRFNRASLINVGYYEAFRAGCNYFAMHDVDLLPENPALNYSFPGLGVAYHVASPEYHPRYNYKSFIGGILILTLQDFKRVNGMSNRYWGWGLEDDEFFLRLREGRIQIERPINLSTNRNNTFLHVHDRRLRKRDTIRVGDQKQVSRRRDRISGLDNVRYEILSRVQMRVEPDAGFWIINVRLHCDKEFSPWCEFPVHTPPTPAQPH